MTSPDNSLEHAAELRRQAEDIARENTAESSENLDALSPEEIRQTLHELRVHQIELSLQNEELRRMQVELDAARARYFDLYDLAPVGYVTVSQQGLLLEANLAAATLLGVARGALVKRPLSQFILSEDRDIYYLHRKQLFETGVPLTWELRLLKQGVAPTAPALWAMIQATVHRDTNGEPVCHAVLSDISERKRAEEALLVSETRFREIVNASPVPMALNDEQRYITFLNPAFVQTFGYTQEDIPTLAHWWPRAYPDLEYRQWVAKAWQAELEHAKRTGAVFSPMELAVSCKDGTSKIVLASATSLCNSFEGTHLVVLHDITERKQAERQLEQYAVARESSNQALREANHAAETATRVKSQFLANMSHEIRTPMTAILGYAELLLEEHVDHATQAHVAVIKRSGEKLLGLINDILDLSKIEAGKMQVEPIRCSPCELVAEVISFMRVRAAAKQLKLQTELAGPLPATVLTDPSRLRQVLINLLGNAIKFTDQGEIRLTVRLISERDPPRLRFDVTDTGIGMNAEQIGQLFQPFAQVENSSTRKYGGTGLGLCISKHLAEILGGDIQVRSQPGQGSTFTLTIDPGPLDGIRLLPAGVQTVLPPPPCAVPTAVGPSVLHGRILLAEDGEDNQRLLALLLRRAGAEVTAVENGQQAVAAAWAAHEAGEPFDVILMDMQMPVLDGFDATRQLRRRGYTAPIVALTAYAMVEDGRKCLAAGCSDYATKPIDRQKLLATVAPWASRGRTPKSRQASSVASHPASSTGLLSLLYSDLDFADDPELGELVDLFVGQMPDRIKVFESQAQSRDWHALARFAHQLKGAAGSYGFDAITPSAVQLEAAVREAQSEERILSSAAELVSLCRRMRAGSAPT
ncbi:MAG: ATP-binding protein [Planctomycetota bacterium]|nr:ATP-binding protein [Planctomycetota bacterium]